VKVLFWSSLAVIIFTYAGYPLLVYFRARLWPLPIRRSNIFPKITILLCAYNEENRLLEKLDNLAFVEYPKHCLDIVVVSDGSTDRTNEILAKWTGPGQQSLILPVHRGKAAALNSGMGHVTGEIVVFTDSRQNLASDALKNLVANFADPAVGCVSGELMICESPTNRSSDGIGLYWRLEKNIRLWEGLAGSTVGATGAFYGVRRNLLRPIPEETILDDVYIPLLVVRQGRRVLFEPKALAWDPFIPTPRQEFNRKLRTLFGNYQLLELAPWVLSASNPVLMQFVCHKLLRLLVPFALIATFVSTFLLRNDQYGFAFVTQVLFYGLAVLGLLRVNNGILSRLSNISLTFTLLNAAAAVAFLYFVTGRKAVWTKP
jgi:biofilm PGA synthesis N-glycosyltransferase PgaC